MSKINIGMHTVVILVGPSQCGKSTWAKILAQKIKEKNENFRTAILSSDEIRRELLGQDLHRYHPEMLEASEAAFDLLFARLHSAVRFPINNEFVIVDTTGLDSDFRFKVADIAKANNYRVCVVLFDYHTNEYFEKIETDSKTVVAKHVEAFKQRVLPGIKRKAYDYSFSVKGKNDENYSKLEVCVTDQKLWEKSSFFNKAEKPLAIIGDVHESVDALKELISTIPPESQIVFLGDLFDKGQDTENMLSYLEELVDTGAMIVVGNHESFVARRLLNKIEAISNEGELFSSLKVFQDCPDLAQRFLKLYENMLPFIVFKNYGKTVYVTHAPCYNSFLGKMSEKAQKFQRNFYFASRAQEDMVSELRFVEEEAKNSHPIHVFGHIAHAMKHMEMKNKIWLDSGAVYGRKLSALLVSVNGARKLVSVNARKLVEGKLLIWKKAETSEVVTPIEISQVSEKKTSEIIPVASDDVDALVRKYKLLPDDIYWLKTFAQSNAKFISGTISPARATEQELEPLKEALKYFKHKGVEQVILQPKWMGSRLQVYLHKDRAKDFAVTRSGAKAGHADMMQKVYDKLHDKFDSLIDYKEQIIFDGELLPWSAIGKELIEKEFLQYGKSIEKEIQLLSEDKVFQGFGNNTKTQEKGIKTFLEQLDIYGQETDIEFKPFSILSVDGENWCLRNQQEIYSLVSEEKYCAIDLYNEGQFQIAESYFKEITSLLKPHEGVVIKPLIYKEGVAPYVKVRNENYLHLIYGYDYLSNYAHMCQNKRVGKKQALSIKQFELGMQMLITHDKQQLMELACQMKFEINQEKELDPRL